VDELARQEQLRHRLAEMASDMADMAEHNAEFMERIAPDEHTGRRRQFAAWERQVAMVERRNADRLRQGDVHNLESLPGHPSGR
jgi:hypothetical protein